MSQTYNLSDKEAEFIEDYRRRLYEENEKAKRDRIFRRYYKSIVKGYRHDASRADMLDAWERQADTTAAMVISAAYRALFNLEIPIDKIIPILKVLEDSWKRAIDGAIYFRSYRRRSRRRWLRRRGQ